MTRARIVLLVLLTPYALVLSCDPAVKCDPGQRYEIGACFVISDASVNSDAATRDDDAGAACTPGPGHYDGFGDSCQANTDCGCLAPSCNTTFMTCTRVNCQNDPDACPPGWTCADVSKLSPKPGVTHVCLQM